MLEFQITITEVETLWETEEEWMREYEADQMELANLKSEKIGKKNKPHLWKHGGHQGHQHPWDGSPRRRGQREAGKISEEIMAENFQNLMRNINLTNARSTNLTEDENKISAFGHIIIKQLKDREKMGKSSPSRAGWRQYDWWLTSHPKWWRGEGTGTAFSKCWKKKCQSRIPYPVKPPFRNGGKLKTFTDKYWEKVVLADLLQKKY